MPGQTTYESANKPIAGELHFWTDYLSGTVLAVRIAPETQTVQAKTSEIYEKATNFVLPAVRGSMPPHP